MIRRFVSFLLLSILSTFSQAIAHEGAHSDEVHLRNIRQLTFGGDNAEAYFSPDGRWLTFQSNNPAWGLKCDQIFLLNIDSAANNPEYKPRMISTGKGRTTCSYFLGNDRILYASTHEGGAECPPEPPPRADRKYLWSIYPTYDIYVADLSGTIQSKLTDTPGYDAEATVSPDGTMIVFTSMRSGDLELWTMHADGTNLKQVTNTLGYDGGAFFTSDGKKLVFRASRPKTDSAQREYKELLAQGLVAPTEMELFMVNVDGSNMVQLTTLGKANWAPYEHPDGKRILFSSNHRSQRGYDFQLYSISFDGTGLEQVTNQSIFNAFPMFSADGKKLVWSSNRNNNGTRDTNMFIADWNE